MLTTSLIIAGAVAFCVDRPQDELCAPRTVAPVELTEARREIIEDTAHRAHRAFNRNPETGDTWRPDGYGDCEDRVLNAHNELRRLDPVLAAAAYVLLVRLPRRNGVMYGHIVLGIDIEGGRTIIIDPERRGFRFWQGEQSYHAPDGIGGHWQKWDPVISSQDRHRPPTYCRGDCTWVRR